MRLLPFLLIVCVGCVDLAKMRAYSDGHQKVALESMERLAGKLEAGSPEAELLQDAHWHVHRARRWNRPLKRMAGPADVVIPRNINDASHVFEEDYALAELDQQVERSKALPFGDGGGLNGLLGGGGVALTLLGVGAKLIKGKLKAKDAALEVANRVKAKLFGALDHVKTAAPEQVVAATEHDEELHAEYEEYKALRCRKDMQNKAQEKGLI